MPRPLRFPAVPRSLQVARAAVREQVGHHGVDADLAETITLCVNEAVANAVLHAYRGRPEGGEVELEISRLEDALCVYVRDSGLGMGPRPDSPGAGYGLSLIFQLASGVSIRSARAEGTELAMRFDLAAPA